MKDIIEQRKADIEENLKSMNNGRVFHQDNTEKVCEKNCPDFNGMSILHTEQCQCSCHPVLAKGEILVTDLN